MFSYYGSKSKLAALYPAPEYPTVIEPFAGSARYSLLHWRHSVKLYDISPLIVDLWTYLMGVTEDEILGLPDIPSKVNIDNFDLTEIQKTLIGFHLCRGKAKPRKVGHGQNGWSRDKERIASSLYKIRHWGIELKDYRDIPNEEATWFIDPPYQRICVKGNGDRYPHSEIDYQELAEWTRSRRGQVIVCEGEGANWLPFKPFKTINGNTNNRTVKRSVEMVYLDRPLKTPDASNASAINLQSL